MCGAAVYELALEILLGCTCLAEAAVMYDAACCHWHQCSSTSADLNSHGHRAPLQALPGQEHEEEEEGNDADDDGAQVEQAAPAAGFANAPLAAGTQRQQREAAAGPRSSGLTLQTELSGSDSEMPDDSIVMVLHVARGRLAELQASHLAKLEGVVGTQQLKDGMALCAGGLTGLLQRVCRRGGRRWWKLLTCGWLCMLRCGSMVAAVLWVPCLCVQSYSRAVWCVPVHMPPAGAASRAMSSMHTLTGCLLLCCGAGRREPCHRLAVTLLSQRGRISALNRLQRRHRELLLGVFLSDNEPPGEWGVPWALGTGA